MNVYLNYYREHEMSAGDNPPVGLILCAQKNDLLVRYATTGLSEQLFVSNYQIGLPSEAELRTFLQREQQRLDSEVSEAKQVRITCLGLRETMRVAR
ncbi:hypothetical protein GCM10027346_42230 [Hymenobacter seoulensis]